MWVITLYSKDEVTMFEFDTVREAKETYNKLQGVRILSQILIL